MFEKKKRYRRTKAQNTNSYTKILKFYHRKSIKRREDIMVDDKRKIKIYNDNDLADIVLNTHSLLDEQPQQIVRG